MKKKILDISKKYTPSELAESFVFRSELTPKEKSESDNALRALRKKAVEEMSEGEKLSMDLLSLKFQMEDYAKEMYYDLEKRFGLFLKKYAKIIRRKNYELADDIGMDGTRFSQIINGHIIPSEKLVYRLEYHCNNIIPGIVWLEVLHKDIEQKALKDIETRTAEYKTVKKCLNLHGKVSFVNSKKTNVQMLAKNIAGNFVYANQSKDIALVREKKTVYITKSSATKNLPTGKAGKKKK